MQSKPHPYADVLRAIADGIPVQRCPIGQVWLDFNPEKEPIYIGNQWRIKPKSKVKMWRWVYKSTNGPRPELLQVTLEHFKGQSEIEAAGFSTITFVEKVLSTEIEVEE